MEYSIDRVKPEIKLKSLTTDIPRLLANCELTKEEVDSNEIAKRNLVATIKDINDLDKQNKRREISNARYEVSSFKLKLEQYAYQRLAEVYDRAKDFKECFKKRIEIVRNILELDFDKEISMEELHASRYKLYLELADALIVEANKVLSHDINLKRLEIYELQLKEANEIDGKTKDDLGNELYTLRDRKDKINNLKNDGIGRLIQIPYYILLDSDVIRLIENYVYPVELYENEETKKRAV